MQRHVLMKLPATALVLLSFGVSAPLSAQDLTITNARIIGANGTVIERGSIVVRARKNRFRGGRRAIRRRAARPSTPKA